MTEHQRPGRSVERTYQVVIDGAARHVSVERRGGTYRVCLDGREYQVDLAQANGATLSLRFPDDRGRMVEARFVEDGDGAESTLHIGGRTVRARVDDAFESRRGGQAGRTVAAKGGSGRVTAPMPGKVVRVLVAAGDRVALGQPVAIVEAMKMENELRAGREGTVKDVVTREGASVEAGALLLLIE